VKGVPMASLWRLAFSPAKAQPPVGSWPYSNMGGVVDRGLVLHIASRHALGVALLAWILVTAGRLAVGDGWNDNLAETGYRMATGIGFMALAWFGTLNVYYGVVRDFSISQIVVTTFALGMGGFGVHVAFSTLSLPPFLLAATMFVLGEAAIGALLSLKARREARHSVSRPVIEPTIRGSGAVLNVGAEGVRLVPRNETGRNTPAERFEQRLIRHIERALEIEAVSMAGTNASYWRFRLADPPHVVEMAVIGPGYNTASPMRPGERWLLRIREPKPCVFTDWIGKHFGPEGQGVTRNLGVLKQTQFASSLLDDDNEFFADPIPWPSADDAGVANGDGPWVIRVFRMDEAEDDAEPDAVPAKKPTLH